ncbi:hypothetical protein GGX14DRAFT_405043 [Mycena pura]|uniref:Uncharacterized protein n=1 Tax=Mycena pura TaxID=153505 RepID=A0AAD6UTH4_9AGAR|nr:hypothetical protein GGX14DRAFT_405043 [Mycena pura]
MDEIPANLMTYESAVKTEPDAFGIQRISIEKSEQCREGVEVQILILFTKTIYVKQTSLSFCHVGGDPLPLSPTTCTRTHYVSACCRSARAAVNGTATACRSPSRLEPRHIRKATAILDRRQNLRHPSFDEVVNPLRMEKRDTLLDKCGSTQRNRIPDAAHRCGYYQRGRIPDTVAIAGLDLKPLHLCQAVSLFAEGFSMQVVVAQCSLAGSHGTPDIGRCRPATTPPTRSDIELMSLGNIMRHQLVSSSQRTSIVRRGGDFPWTRPNDAFQGDPVGLVLLLTPTCVACGVFILLLLLDSTALAFLGADLRGAAKDIGAEHVGVLACGGKHTALEELAISRVVFRLVQQAGTVGKQAGTTCGQSGRHKWADRKIWQAGRQVDGAGVASGVQVGRRGEQTGRRAGAAGRQAAAAALYRRAGSHMGKAGRSRQAACQGGWAEHTAVKTVSVGSSYIESAETVQTLLDVTNIHHATVLMRHFRSIRRMCNGRPSTDDLATIPRGPRDINTIVISTSLQDVHSPRFSPPAAVLASALYCRSDLGGQDALAATHTVTSPPSPYACDHPQW